MTVTYQAVDLATPAAGVVVKTRTSGGEHVQAVDVETLPNVTLAPQILTATTTYADSLTMSEFGEVRVAAPANRFDVEFQNDKQPLLVDDISTGAGSAVHQANGRAVLLSVGGTTINDSGGVRGHVWVPYTPGSGQEIDITGTLDAVNLGGGTVSAFLRSTVSGSTTLTTVPQSDWVAAASGVNWQYSQIYRLSFQSLRVGRIQFGLVRNGIPVKVCELNNDNVRLGGYWQYASLPPYWKVFNDASNTIAEIGYGDELNGIGFRYVFNGKKSTAQVLAICCTVKSQGGVPVLDLPGTPWVTPIPTAKTVSSTLIPVLSVRVASTFNAIANRALVIPTGYSVTTDQPIDYALIYRPTLTGPSWSAIDATYNGVEYDVTASALSGGYRVGGAYLAGSAANPRNVAGLLERVIMSLGSGSADILTLAAIRSSTSNASVRAYLEGREIR